MRWTHHLANVVPCENALIVGVRTPANTAKNASAETPSVASSCLTYEFRILIITQLAAGDRRLNCKDFRELLFAGLGFELVCSVCLVELFRLDAVNEGSWVPLYLSLFELNWKLQHVSRSSPVGH